MRWNLLMDELAEDLRNGFRQIARNPGFTAIVALTLALGIGANDALFSIFNRLILRRPCTIPEVLRCSPTAHGPIRSGARSRHARRSCSTARSPGPPRGSTCRPAVKRNRSIART